MKGDCIQLIERRFQKLHIFSFLDPSFIELPENVHFWFLFAFYYWIKEIRKRKKRKKRKKMVIIFFFIFRFQTSKKKKIQIQSDLNTRRSDLPPSTIMKTLPSWSSTFSCWTGSLCPLESNSLWEISCWIGNWITSLNFLKKKKKKLKLMRKERKINKIPEVQ